MDFSVERMLVWAGNACYVGLAAAALYGVYCVIVLFRRIRQKRFASYRAARDFLDTVRGHLQQRDLGAIAELCDSPPYWSKAVPQLIMLALENRTLGIPKLKRLLGERFEREILADIEYRTSWVSTIVKAAPMLGLQGTVVGMIAAFAKISTQSRTGIDPAALASDISLALWTTADGLAIAIPLVLAGNMVNVRIGKLQDSVQDQLGEFLQDLEAAMNAPGAPLK